MSTPSPFPGWADVRPRVGRAGEPEQAELVPDGVGDRETALVQAGDVHLERVQQVETGVGKGGGPLVAPVREDDVGPDHFVPQVERNVAPRRSSWGHVAE
jgi:hypothetical protein